MKKNLLLLCSLFALVAVAQKKQQNSFNEESPSLPFARTITPVALKEKLSIIASAEMEGRETAMPGQKKAAAYIESQFRKMQLLPGNGAGGYQQTFTVYRDTIVSEKIIVAQTTLERGKDFYFVPTHTADKDFTLTTNAVVFVGYGIVDSAQNIDDYKGFNVKDKIVVVSDGYPEGYTPKHGQSKARTAAKAGAAALLIIVPELPQNPTAGGIMYVKNHHFASTQIPIGIIALEAVARIMDIPVLSMSMVMEKANTQKQEYDIPISITLKHDVQELQSSNVIGMLQGTDKADEYVVISAHYDHLGKKENDIYFGADDDGSGTTSVLQMAEAFCNAKNKGVAPRRTLVFMTVSGEEKGLWGSDYYTSNPTYPLNKTSVDLNIDMIGRCDPSYKGDSLNYLYIIGDDKLSSDLASIADTVNQTFQLELDRRYNDLNDPNRFYYRSDHYNFAKHGVPIIFYFNGVHRDYHKPTDTVDKINFQLMAKRAQYVFCTAWAIANKDNMLKRDIPLSADARE